MPVGSALAGLAGRATRGRGAGKQGNACRAARAIRLRASSASIVRVAAPPAAVADVRLLGRVDMAPGEVERGERLRLAARAAGARRRRRARAPGRLPGPRSRRGRRAHSRARAGARRPAGRRPGRCRPPRAQPVRRRTPRPRRSRRASATAIRGTAAPAATGGRASGSPGVAGRAAPASSTGSAGQTRLRGMPANSGSSGPSMPSRARAASRRASPGPAERGHGFGGDDEREGVFAVPGEQRVRRLARAREVARAPAHLREVEQRRLVEHAAAGERLELGPRERERAHPHVEAREPERDRAALVVGAGRRGGVRRVDERGVVRDGRGPRPGMDLGPRATRARIGRCSARRRGVVARGVCRPAGVVRPRLVAGRRRLVEQPAAGVGHRGSRRWRSRPRRCLPGRDDGHPQRLVAEQLRGKAADVVGLDRLDGRERLVEREHPVVERLLPADPRREVARVVHPQLEAARQVRLRLGELVARDGLVDEPRELREDRLDRRGQGRRGRRRPTPRAHRRRRTRRSPTTRRRRGPSPRARRGTGGSTSRRPARR